ncbi:MAG: nucleotidyltransferase domain-containing protein [Candidatus Bathyarchaeota archaeon]|nr:hypothetical protein [Candidatus Bathyarchaeota archaeon A05DMB-5]MDH7557174.1 nucleotidyltransferase domain-containing protein [Candidatus Bathyarchaeota archaeon]
MDAGGLHLRKKVAREAATLLYSGIEKEYKQAKLKAAKTFGVHFVPTNFEVALELDKIAEEKEGLARQERLIRMRTEALKLMKILEEHGPKLVGSVWRGTIHHESDIDITVYHNEPNDIIEILKRNGFHILQTEWMAVTKKGQKKTSFHIHLESPTKEKIEIIVRNPEETQLKEKCEIYGDEVTGLHVRKLEKLLKENPLQRFIPFLD